MMEWKEFVIAALPIAAPMLPVLGAVVLWFANEVSKRRAESYQRKERRYISLLESLSGFMVSADAKTASQKKTEFLHQLDLCWLYCPPRVVRKGYAFLDKVSTGVRYTDEQQKSSLQEFVESLRRDLRGPKLSLKDLRASEFRLLAATSHDFESGTHQKAK